ncbi:hypothetical protein VT84_21420 [Gemmata sp. SH-PL17]|uniref:hypothetical protein n=1 Tax=Gemmata sp. SH-PL17 TaxID=1630693 RepID=UPI00078C015D|nr:hypothetical protein [Gemmata sp. SH-PL17]AMV26976.1 hypothetical protein VT84_21420 [Gemmata sp. SH-PL17]
MASDVQLKVSFRGEEDFLIEFPDESITVSVPYTPVEEGRFRLDGVPLGVEAAGFKDVIEAELVEEGKLRFQRVVEPSNWRTYEFILPAHRIDTEWGQFLLQELDAQGGHWERMFGGLLFTCIPPGLDLDPTPWVNDVSL